MKKIIPFKKNILFKTNLDEITSISLEDSLNINNNAVIGNFIVSGEYKMNSSSINTEGFNYDLPVEISIDDKYNLSKATVNVTDFYYEIVDNNSLDVNIEVTIDKMEEIPVIEDVRNDTKEEIIEEIPIICDEIKEETIDTRCIETEDTSETLFKYEDSDDIYVTYSIYIVRETDTIDTILNKYNIDKETLAEYNDIKELKIGDKLIIPTNA
ncbi:MAG: LysM peptidoglycan-binding domain-containing protein [Clostridium sp.]|nr:LysM peptidoglycan-binding domain-containing protein [Clostridium sp.]MCM1444507.1 LysM peptidoglycan-binding domain-containing protein [Candidatus Amulumruptor caecigallinarius]